MSSRPSPCRESIAEVATGFGVTALGVTDACAVDYDAVERSHRWLADGRHGEMKYLEKYDEVRSDPRLLLDGARSVIVAAFNYYPPKRRNKDMLQIAAYALGKDYHEAVKERLENVAAYIRETWGGETRVCVDTAPLRERYWAVKSGVGFIGRNGLLIVPGRGSYFFIGTILTTVHFEPTEACRDECAGCGACITACPGGALCGDGTVDARRCLSYLTIEYRGEFPEGLSIGNRLYGCDECQSVCPHNRTATPTEIEEFMPSEELLALSAEDIKRMTPEEFSRIFRHSAIRRTKLTGLQRNLRQVERREKGNDNGSNIR